MQRQQDQGNINQKVEKHIPIELVTSYQEEHSCPTAIMAYKFLCQLSKTSLSNNCVDFTHHTLAEGLRRPLQKSMCALNCLERMGYIKILNLENETKGSYTNTVELLHEVGQGLRKTA